MNSKYRIITNPNSEQVEFQVGDLVTSTATNFIDDMYGWYSPEQLGVVQEVTYMEITDYFLSAEKVHIICELKIYWPKTQGVTHLMANQVAKLSKITGDNTDVSL
tara:strand:+ start:1806 stop:2120 length:315 start_codon:yes stop_codon:yes gene_type:complete